MLKESLKKLDFNIAVFDWQWNVDEDVFLVNENKFMSIFSEAIVPSDLNGFLEFFSEEDKEEVKEKVHSLLYESHQEVELPLILYEYKNGYKTIKTEVSRGFGFGKNKRILKGMCVCDDTCFRKLHELNTQKNQLQESLNLTDTLYKLERNVLSQKRGAQTKEFENLLHSLLHYTECQFGFIGEVVQEYGEKVFWSYANSIEFNQNLVLDTRHDGTKIKKFIEYDRGIGKSLKFSKALIVKDPDRISDMFWANTADWKTFLSIPIKNNEEVIGLIGLVSNKNISLNLTLKKVVPYISCLSNIINFNKFDRIRNRKERELKRNESRLRHFYHNINVPILMINPTTLSIVDCNESILNVLGYSREEFLGLDLNELDSKYNANFLFASMKRVMKERVVQGRTVWKAKDGRPINVLLQNSVIESEGEDTIMTTGYEIPDYQGLVEELNLSQKITGIVVSSMEEGILIWDEKGVIVEANEYIESIFGGHDGKFENYLLKIFENFDVKDIDGRKLMVNQFSFYHTFVTKGKIRDEIIRISNGEEERWFNVSTWLIKEGKGKPLYVGKLHDITLLRKSQESLIESKRNLDLFFNQSLFGFFFLKLENPLNGKVNVPDTEKAQYLIDHLQVSKVNLEMLRQKNMLHLHAKGMSAKDFFKNDILENKGLWVDLIKDGIAFAETEIKKEDGSVIWLQGDYGCIYDIEGKITGVFGIRKDISTNMKIRQALEQEEQKFNSFFENAPVGILTLDNDGFIKTCNTQCADMFGVNSNKLLHENLFDLFYFSKDKENTVSLLQTYLQNSEDEKFVEASKGIMGKKNNGTKFPVEVFFSHFTLDGHLQKMIFIRDISEKARAEHNRKLLDERETLLKEIHHRVKNNMQVVSSLLSLQASNIKDENALIKFKESEMRIKSMALIHEQLYESNSLSEINVKEYLTQLTKNIVSSYSLSNNVMFNISMDDLKLPLDYCIPFGLILNEFLTNAMKYAFTGIEQPELVISLTKLNEKVILIVQDNGVGLQTDLSKSRGLGMKLVRSLVKQLRGDYTVENEEGVKCTLTFEIHHESE